MERTNTRLIRHCLIVSLIAISTLGMVGCSKSASIVTSANGATMDYFIVTPDQPPDLPVGSTQQFTAIATFSDKSTENISSQVTWKSSNTKAAIISSAGLATGMTSGTTNITATISGITSLSRTLNVIPASATTSSTTQTTTPLTTTNAITTTTAH